MSKNIFTAGATLALVITTIASAPTGDFALPTLAPLPALPTLAPLPALPTLATLPALPELPQLIPPRIPSLDPEARSAQARSVLDDLLSRFPTLIDGAAALLDGQMQLLEPLRTLPTIPQLPAPALPALPEMPNFLTSVPQGRSTPFEAEAPATSRQSTLSALLDPFLSNIRGVATAPLAITGTANSLLNGAAQLATPPVPVLGRARLTVPFIVWAANEAGLEPNQLAEQIKQKIRDQSAYWNSAPNAQIVFDLAHNILDIKPLHPKPSTPPPNPDSPAVHSKTTPVEESLGSDSSSSESEEAHKKGFYSQRGEPVASRREPPQANLAAGARPAHRFFSPGSALSGPSDVQIFMKSHETAPFDQEELMYQ